MLVLYDQNVMKHYRMCCVQATLILYRQLNIMYWYATAKNVIACPFSFSVLGPNLLCGMI